MPPGRQDPPSPRRLPAVDTALHRAVGARIGPADLLDPGQKIQNHQGTALHGGVQGNRVCGHKNQLELDLLSVVYGRALSIHLRHRPGTPVYHFPHRIVPAASPGQSPQTGGGSLYCGGPRPALQPLQQLRQGGGRRTHGLDPLRKARRGEQRVGLRLRQLPGEGGAVAALRASTSRSLSSDPPAEPAAPWPSSPWPAAPPGPWPTGRQSGRSGYHRLDC